MNVHAGEVDPRLTWLVAEEGALDANVTTKVACAQRMVMIHLYLTVLIGPVKKSVNASRQEER